MANMTMAEAGRLGWEKTKQHFTAEYEKRKAVWDANPKKCKFCDGNIEYSKRANDFCSRSCAASFNNKGKPKHGKSPVAHPCEGCGKITKKKTCCSRKCSCFIKWNTLKKSIIHSNCVPNDQTGKKFILERDGHKCSVCGLTEWMGKVVPLVLDHISGHSSDQSLVNLRLVCGNCDMQLLTYKSKNRGNGRKNRRKRYADGKSF